MTSFFEIQGIKYPSILVALNLLYVYIHQIMHDSNAHIKHNICHKLNYFPKQQKSIIDLYHLELYCTKQYV